MHDFIEKLDRILLLKNTIIRTELTFNALVEYISSLLKDYCKLFEKRFYTDFYEYRLLYSCNENKTCVHVIIKPTPITIEHDRITPSVVLQGGKCE